MLFTNEEFTPTRNFYSFGDLMQVTLGEKGRGRWLEQLTVPDDCRVIPAGMNPDLTVTKTRSGRPKVVRASRSQELYMLLTSQQGYTRRGDGFISYLASTPQPECLLYGRGADGLAGRIGCWSAGLIRVQPGTVVQVVKSGGLEEPVLYYVTEELEVLTAPLSALPDMVDALGIPLPERYLPYGAVSWPLAVYQLR